MKKSCWILIILFGIVLISFLIGAVIPNLGYGCTEMACPCQGVMGERPCNSCSSTNAFFISGIINVVKNCGGKEIIICENNQQTDMRIELDKSGCDYDLYILWFRLK